MSKLITSVAVAASVAFPMAANAGTYYKLGSDANCTTPPCLTAFDILLGVPAWRVPR